LSFEKEFLGLKKDLIYLAKRCLKAYNQLTLIIDFQQLLAFSVLLAYFLRFSCYMWQHGNILSFFIPKNQMFLDQILLILLLLIVFKDYDNQINFISFVVQKKFVLLVVLNFIQQFANFIVFLSLPVIIHRFHHSLHSFPIQFSEFFLL